MEETLELIPIDRVFPDPSQPRKLLPLDLALAASQGRPMDEILDQLYKRSAENRALQSKLQNLEALALSIADDSLLEPIRVIPCDGGKFIIEEGERRWLAHHLLYFERQDETFKHIKALIVQSSNAESNKHLLRRRIAENVHRSELNAIEMALALEARVQEISNEKPDFTQREVEVIIGRENHMTDRRVRQFLSLLSLAPEALELAKESDLTERTLRQVLKLSDPKAQLVMLRSLIQPKETRQPRKSKNNTHRRGSSREQKKMKVRNRETPLRVATNIISLARVLEENSSMEKALIEAVKQQLAKDKQLRPAIQRLSSLLIRSI